MEEKRLEELVGNIQKLQKDYSKTLNNRQQLEAQLQENKMVQDEFKVLKEDSVVYKLIGPVLVKQDTSEAVQNVDKRIEFISNEIKRVEGLLKDYEKKLETSQTDAIKLQQALQLKARGQ